MFQHVKVKMSIENVISKFNPCSVEIGHFNKKTGVVYEKRFFRFVTHVLIQRFISKFSLSTM